MQIETWPIDRIIPYHKNAKIHKVDQIAASIREFRIDQPIVVDQNGVIIKGHGRLKAAKKLGLAEFPVVVRKDLTAEQVRLARIADNRVSEGGWNPELLQDDLKSLFQASPSLDFSSFGISNDWLSQFASESSVFNFSENCNEPAEKTDESAQKKPVHEMKLIPILMELSPSEFKKWKELKKKYQVRTDKELILKLIGEEL